MKKEFAQSPEIYAYASMLAGTFVRRKDLFALQLEDGRYQCVRKPLLEKHVIAHLNGDLTLGTYVLGTDNRTRFAVIDADDDLQMSRLANISISLAEDGIPSHLEMSRRGGHMWIFFDQSIPGQIARAFGKNIIDSNDLGKIELFPKQDHLGDGPGSLIRLPFGIHRKDGQRYGFVTPRGEPIAATFADQIQMMSNPSTVEQPALDEFISQYKAFIPKPTFIKSEPVGSTLSEQIKRSATVLDFVGEYVELSTAGRGLCPFHDDHHMSFSVNAEKNYWHCFSGCGGGSIIDFWMKWQDVDFRQAIKELAGSLLKNDR